MLEDPMKKFGSYSDSEVVRVRQGGMRNLGLREIYYNILKTCNRSDATLRYVTLPKRH